MKNILIFGDSITQGYFAIDNYVVRLILKYLKFTIKNRELVFVQNLGKIADTSKSLLNRIENNIQKRNHFGKNIIIISTGLNDSKFSFKTNSTMVSEKEYLKNLKEIYAISKKYSDKIIFVGLTKVDESKTNPCFWDKHHSYENKRIMKYDKVLRTFTKKNKITYIKMFDKIKTNLLIDGLHPTSKGHKIFYKLIEQELN